MSTNREQQKLSRESKFDCKCIDRVSLANLRLSLITAKDTYEDIASKLMRMDPDNQSIGTLYEKAIKFHKLLQELDKVQPC